MGSGAEYSKSRLNIVYKDGSSVGTEVEAVGVVEVEGRHFGFGLGRWLCEVVIGLAVVGLLFFKRFFYFGNPSKFLDKLNFYNQLWKLNI